MKFYKKLLKPFSFLQERTLFYIGISFGALGIIMQVFTHSRYISPLSMADIGHAPYLWQSGLDYIISTLVLSVLLYILGRFINKGTRFIDLLNTVLIARIALLVTIPFDYNGKAGLVSQRVMETLVVGKTTQIATDDLIYLTLLSIAALIALILFCYYLYQGFRTATHVKKVGQIILFVVVVICGDFLIRFLTTNY